MPNLSAAILAVPWLARIKIGSGAENSNIILINVYRIVEKA
jgi:hypothetical protein